MGTSMLSTFTGLGDTGLSTLSTVLAIFLGGAVLLWLHQVYTVYSCRSPIGVLPKGSLGWPIVGESFDFVRDPREFAQSRVKRYGNTFKTNLFLRPTIFGTTPEFAKFINNNNHLFRRSFPESLRKIIGTKSLMLQDGPPHMAVRKVVLKAVGPESLRGEVHNFEDIILRNMASWVRAGTVVGMDAMQQITWETSNWILFGDKNPCSSAVGRKNFENFKKIVATTVSMPVNLPGTTYNIGMKARDSLITHFKNMIRKAQSQKASTSVFFDALLAAMEDPEGREDVKHFDIDTVAENMFLINAAAYDTTSTTLAWTLKYLIDYPEVFRRCQAEHQEILKSKDPSVEGPRLTWEDTRKMVYTNKFFQEVQRAVSLIPFILREAIEDVTFEGHLIPKGWISSSLINFIHSDPANYPDVSFNPDRFDVPPKPYSFIPFSTGPHMCPGVEMAKLTSSILVHYLTTTYTHERAGPDQGTEYEGFFPKPKGGYPIKLRPRT